MPYKVEAKYDRDWVTVGFFADSTRAIYKADGLRSFRDARVIDDRTGETVFKNWK